jgi:hypothetical protein
MILASHFSDAAFKEIGKISQIFSSPNFGLHSELETWETPNGQIDLI